MIHSDDRGAFRAVVEQISALKSFSRAPTFIVPPFMNPNVLVRFRCLLDHTCGFIVHFTIFIILLCMKYELLWIYLESRDQRHLYAHIHCTSHKFCHSTGATATDWKPGSVRDLHVSLKLLKIKYWHLTKNGHISYVSVHSFPSFKCTPPWTIHFWRASTPWIWPFWAWIAGVFFIFFLRYSKLRRGGGFRLRSILAVSEGCSSSSEKLPNLYSLVHPADICYIAEVHDIGLFQKFKHIFNIQ